MKLSDFQQAQAGSPAAGDDDLAEAAFQAMGLTLESDEFVFPPSDDTTMHPPADDYDLHQLLAGGNGDAHTNYDQTGHADDIAHPDEGRSADDEESWYRHPPLIDYDIF